MVGSDQKHRPTLAATTIPDDILISEILIHLPAKSLARCRCVCRSWRAGIAGAAFVRRHRDLSRARPPSSVLIIHREYDRLEYRPRATTTTEISFHRLVLPPPPRGQHVATEAADADLMLDKAWPDGITNVIYPTHCDGLVAISTATDRVFRARRRANAVPVAIGFDTWRNSYVAASCDVMMRFDLKDRVFEVVAHPPTGAWRPFDEMADLDDGKLCYIHAVADASKKTMGPDLHWSLRCYIHLPDAVPKRPYVLMPLLLVVAADDGDTLVASAGDTLYKCNMKNGSTVEVVDMQQRLQYNFDLAYVM
ncbi:hypothetical protein HU200_052690 [Digitaria exilis]|uniref:F-box domain-containing protein n=1 Tax=Digitaria exilis TaxID=1010633 RepID=A0A835E6W3_9POAL|nr:hypothetical protein HU200_052690 [Digitaria exilis]